MNALAKGTTFAKLRLLGDKLDPDEITQILGEDPTYSSLAQPWPTNPPITSSRGAVWELESENAVTSPDTDKHIEWLLDLLDKAGHLAIDLPNVDRAEIFCWWQPPLGIPKGPAGPHFSPAILEKLARHGLSLSVGCV